MIKLSRNIIFTFATVFTEERSFTECPATVWAVAAMLTMLSCVGRTCWTQVFSISSTILWPSSRACRLASRLVVSSSTCPVMKLKSEVRFL